MYNYEDFESIKTITNFNEIINFGYTHSYHICYYHSDNLEVIKYCVENGADFNITDNDNWTTFHWICYNKITKEVLEYCLENGADLTIKNDYERTPFYYNNKDLIPICKPYIDEYDFVKTLKECNLNWKEYV